MTALPSWLDEYFISDGGGGAELPIVLTTDVDGVLPVANGGTSSTTATGSGAVVLGSSPTLATPTLTTPQINGGRAELDSLRVKGEVVNAQNSSQDDIPRAAIIRCTGDGLIITGIDATGAEHGEICELWVPIGLSTGIVVKHQDTNSVAGNRIITPTATDWNLYEQSIQALRYDATTQRWRVIRPGF